MRAATGFGVVVLLLAAGCGPGRQPGVVNGNFLLPGRPAADVQRGGLNFSSSSVHGSGHGHTVRVDATGWYSISLPPGSYDVIGALSGGPDGSAAEACAGSMDVVVTKKTTTRLDFVCHASGASAP